MATVQDVEMEDVDPPRVSSPPALPGDKSDVKIAHILKRLENSRRKGLDQTGPSEYLDQLKALTSQQGMPDGGLLTALRIATSGTLSAGHASKLLATIRPRRIGAISKDFVVRAVGRLGDSWAVRPQKLKTKVVDWKVQAVVLKQLILLLPYMDESARRTLDCLYGVVFGCLGSHHLKGYACHLLYIITKREHVKYFRIDRLLTLRRTLSDLAEANQIAGLLRLYREYYPDLVVADVGRNLRQNLFTSPDPAWAEMTAEIVARSNAASEGVAEDDGRRGMEGRAAKRAKLDRASFIPSRTTLLATEESSTLTEYQSVVQLGRRIDKMDLPSRAASSLEGISSMGPKSRLGAWAMTVAGDRTYLHRFDNWLLATLEDLFHASDFQPMTTLRAEDLLNRAAILSRIQGRLSPAMEGFLVNFWRTWDGDICRTQLFSLLALWRPVHFEDLYWWTLDPLAQIARSSDDQWKASLIRALQDLIMSWTRLRGQALSGEVDDLTMSDAELCESLKHLVTYVDRFGTAAILAHPDSVTLRTAVLSLHEVLPSLPLDHDVAVLAVPSYAVVYSSLFGDIASLSLICGVLARYKSVLESNEPKAAQQGVQKRTPFKEPFTSAFLTSFNAYLMNACNLYWRGKALTKEDKNADSCGLDPSWVKALLGKASRNGRDLKVIFGITQSAAFINFATEHLRSLEQAAGIPLERRHHGPITSQHLKELAARDGLSITYSELRIGLIDYLEERGAVGLSSFLHVSLSSLMLRPRKSVGSTPTSTPKAQRQPVVNLAT